MKLNLPNLLKGMLLFSFSTVAAQDYQPLSFTTGLNADVVANGIGASSVTSTFAVDNANFAFFSTDFQATATSPLPATGLPATGLINSLVTPGLSYQMASYSGNNVLRLPLQNNSGTLAVTTPLAASKLFLLVTSGSGVSSLTGTITFSDDSTQPIGTTTVPDWFNSTALPIAASGFGRLNRANNVIENPAGNPRLYQMTINILSANQTKTISGITLTKSSTAEGVINVFAISAEIIPTCPSPTDLIATSTANSGTVSWTASVIAPGAGYDYYYATVNTTPTATTVPTGNVATGTNTVTIPGLVTGTQYYFWVRSNCSETDKGVWKPVSFTTGQTSATYTAGDVSTLYNTAPTVTTATTCPAILSVTVPAGYQIASVATTYNMTAQGGGWKSEQRSYLYCTTTSTGETTLTAGTGGTAGTQSYSRTGLTLANGAQGTVNFELRSFRTYGGTGCSTEFNKIDNNTWTVTVTYAALPCTTPAAPTAVAQTLCNGATIAGLTATGVAGATFNWYSTETGGTALASSTAVVQGTYYVSQSTGTCESTRVPITVTVTTVALPEAATAQTFCAGTQASSLTATAATGATLNWYNSLTATTIIAPDAVLASGNYYVSQTLDGCESIRTAITVTVNTTAIVVPAADQAYCNGTTVSDISTTLTDGATLNVYATETATAPIAGTDAIAAGTYYLSQTLNGCESAKIAVVVTTITTAMPTASAQTFCSGATVSQLLASGVEGSVVNWYASQTGSPLTGTDTLISGTYFVSQTLNGCESVKQEVVITINTTDAPTASTIQSFCTGATAQELSATAAAGAQLNWYTNADGSTTVDEGALLVAGTYYVSQTLNGCESVITAINVIINIIPTAPAGDATQTFTTGETAANLDITTETGATANYYVMNDAMELVMVSLGEILIDGTVYYITQTLNGCESEPIQVTASEILGNAEFFAKNLKVYPNPAKEIVTIKNKASIANIAVFNLLGQKVLNQNAANELVTINVSDLAQGNYIIQVTAVDGKVATVKLVKN